MTFVPREEDRLGRRPGDGPGRVARQPTTPDEANALWEGIRDGTIPEGNLWFLTVYADEASEEERSRLTFDPEALRSLVAEALRENARRKGWLDD